MPLRNTEEKARTRARPDASSRPPAAGKRERHGDEIEHAFGAAETKRRNRAVRAKPKARSRSS
jgi:hypothetical protein